MNHYLASAGDRTVTAALASTLQGWSSTSSNCDDHYQALWLNLTAGGWMDLLAGGFSADTQISSDTAIATAELFGNYIVPQLVVVTSGFVVPLLAELADVWPIVPRIQGQLSEGGVIGVPLPKVNPELGNYGFDIIARMTPVGNSYRLTGRIPGYLDLAQASAVLIPVSNEDDSTGLAILDLESSHVSIRRETTVVFDAEACELVLDEVVVDANKVLGVATDEAVSVAGAQWSLALDAYAVGLATHVLQRTVGYAKEREQFDQPIGAFQAVQHHIADMFVAVEISRSLMTAAAKRLHEAPELSDSVMADVHASRLQSAEAAKMVCEQAIQVHGGVGFTWELGLHRWYRAAMFARQYCTDRRGIRNALARMLSGDLAIGRAINNGQLRSTRNE